MKIEQAFDQDGKFVGWRLTSHEIPVLVFHEPNGLEGFRAGPRFNPTHDGSISYKDVTPPIEPLTTQQ